MTNHREDPIARALRFAEEVRLIALVPFSEMTVDQRRVYFRVKQRVYAASARGPRRSPRHWKLDPELVQRIRTGDLSKIPKSKLAKQLGCSRTTIYNARAGITWRVLDLAHGQVTRNDRS